MESFVIIARIATGLILMNESALYTWTQLVSICLTNLVTIFGINIIAKKANFLEGKTINHQKENDLKNKLLGDRLSFLKRY